MLTVLEDLSQESGETIYEKRFEKFSRNDEAFIDDLDQAFKVWPTNPDRRSFQITLTAGGVTELKQKIAEAGPDNHRINSQIPKAFQYFTNTIHDWLQGLSYGPEKGLGALWLVISSQLRLVTIDLEAENEPQVIFETLNSRGADLLPADLIKNYLFRQEQADEVLVGQLYDRYWKAFDDRWWREEMRQGRLKRPRLDIFLH